MALAALLVAVVGQITLISAGPTYFVASPNLLHVGVEETVVITVHEVPAAIPVTIELKNADKSKTFSRKTGIQCPPDTPTTTRVKVTLADLGDEAEEVENLYVWLVASSNSPHMSFTKETQVMVTLRVGHVFLQLDKPIYNPRSEMQLRAFNIGQDLLPSSRTIRLEIKDPDGKVLTREDKAAEAGYPGIVQFTPFKFPQIVTLGMWYATVYYGNKWQYKKEVEFEVREYILPTFEVKVSYDQIITPNSDQATGRVKARYTYGKDVRGTVTVTYGIAYPDRVVEFFTKSEQINNGNYYFTLDVRKIKELGGAQELWFPRVEQDKLSLMVTAQVREDATGSMQEGSTLVPFAKSNFKISLDRTIKFFKPALPFLVNVDVKSLLPLPEESRRIPIRIKVHSINGARRTPLGLYQNAAAETNTTKSGQAKLTIDNVPRDAQKIEIKVSTTYKAGRQRTGPFQNADATLVVSRQQTDGDNSYILIREQQNSVKVGDMLEVQVFSSAQDRTRLSYFVLAQGKILNAHTEVQQAGVLQTLRIPVLPQMSPEARLVVYYYAAKQGRTIVVADSIQIDVVPACRNKVTVTTSSGQTEYRPGGNLDLLIRGAAHSQVALVAVDKAVYLLREAGVLKRDQLFDLLQERDLSCGVGGGLNTATMFKDAGVTIMTNAHLTTPKRSAELCPETVGPHRRKRSVDSPADLEQCCEDGKEARDCRLGAMALVIQGFSDECVKAFFNCCSTAHPPPEIPPEVESDFGGRAGESWQEQQDIFNDIMIDPQLLQKRSQFDESWFWEIHDIDGRAAISKAVTLKDSITTWVFQGVGMSETQGICIAEPLNITAFKTFFIQLDLPKSAVKGEQTEVKATIFNYGNQDQYARVFLEGSEGLCSGAKAGRQGRGRRIIVKAENAFTVSWPVIPLKTGHLPVRVQAFIMADRDYVEKQLYVIPSGKEHEITTTVVLDPSGESIGHVNNPQEISDRIDVIPNKEERKQIVTIDAHAVKNYVSDSGKVALSFWGELMGPVVEEVMNGMEGMVRLPRGCGEQTMIYLGPTLYTAKYLKQTGQMTNEMETKAYGYIRQGVQRMQLFRKPDGSFAVWATHPSSTWLTAFAVKVFAQAQEFNVLTSDITNIICTAVKWIVKYRNPDGSLFDPYKTHHQGDMVGAVHDTQTRTAFILISLLEADCQIQESQTAIRAAVGYLQGQIQAMTRPYDLAIITYALALADSPKKNEANARLKSMSSFNQGLNQRHWPNRLQGARLKSGLKASSLEVETAAYALLAQLKLGDLDYCYAIVNWLIAQRQSQGVFRSTQDTVVGLQALTEYRINTERSETEMEITVTSDKDRDWSKQLTLTEEDILRHQQVELSSHMGFVLTVEIRGRGVAYMDFMMNYNEKVPRSGPQGEQQDCPFQITIGYGECPGGNQVENGVEEEGDEEEECSQITIAARYTGEDPTGMVMIDVGLFSGFKAVKEDLEVIKDTDGNKIAQFELSDRVVHFYVDEIPAGQTVSVSFRMVKKFMVGNVQSVPVKVYKYYDPDVACTKFYHPERGSPLLTYNCAGDVCQCLSGQCGKCHDFLGGDVPLDYGEMRMKSCGTGENVDYVINATVTRIDFTATEEHVTAQVQFVAKQGNDLGMVAGTEIKLIKNLECGCPFLSEHSSYLIMGMDGIAEQAEQGGVRYAYYMNSDTYVTEYLGNRWRQLQGKSMRYGKMQWRFMKNQHSKGCPT